MNDYSEQTFSADDAGRAQGIAWLTIDQETGEDTGHLACFSRYGRTSADCAPVAWILARIVADANGDEITTDELDSCMSIVVNDHDDVESLIREYGTADDLEVAGLQAVSEAQLAEWTAEAREIGRQTGKSAATWIVDGNTSPEHIARMVEMIDALSGEWADDQTPLSLAREITGDTFEEWGDDASSDVMDALAEAWELGVSDAFGDECERILRAALPDKMSALYAVVYG